MPVFVRPPRRSPWTSGGRNCRGHQDPQRGSELDLDRLGRTAQAALARAKQDWELERPRLSRESVRLLELEREQFRAANRDTGNSPGERNAFREQFLKDLEALPHGFGPHPNKILSANAKMREELLRPREKSHRPCNGQERREAPDKNGKHLRAEREIWRRGRRNTTFDAEAKSTARQPSSGPMELLGPHATPFLASSGITFTMPSHPEIQHLEARHKRYALTPNHRLEWISQLK
uniref:Uncharacterized protein n=1 Tax=Sphaerodactylus townsendi TaxID=933632 RepID=A0ACB8FE94_9SAUR